MNLPECRIRMLAAYRAMEPPRVIVTLARELGGGSLDHVAQTFFLKNCCLDQLCRTYPPSKGYVRRVLKEFILAAEQDGHEVEDGLYEQHAALLHLPSEVLDIETKCYRTYSYAVPEDSTSYLAGVRGLDMVPAPAYGVVTLRVSQNMLEADTGCWSWTAGLYLTEFMFTFPQLFNQQSCLELGSGAGLAGITLSRLSPSKVVLSDGSLPALANLKQNLEINGITHAQEGKPPSANNTSCCTDVSCQNISWETITEEELESLHADIILAADVVYDPKCIPHLVRVLQGLLGRPGSAGRAGMHQANESGSPSSPVAFIASVVRNESTMSMFLEGLKTANLYALDVTEMMRPQKCLLELSAFDRSQVTLHQIHA